MNEIETNSPSTTNEPSTITELIRINTESMVGGIAAIFAIIAIIVQCLIIDLSFNSVLNGVISLSQVVANAVVMFVAVRSLLSSPKEPEETFKSVLENGIDAWRKRSRPLISRDKNNPHRYSMLTNHDNILYTAESFPADFSKDDDNCDGVNTGRLSGLFLKLPEKYVKGDKDSHIIFYLNESTFKHRVAAFIKEKKSTDDKKKAVQDEMRVVAAQISQCITANFKSIKDDDKGIVESASSNPSGREIKVIFSRDLSTPEDARSIVKLVEYVMMLYLAAA